MARKACALRASHDCLHPRLRRPLERGSTKRRRKSQDKGAQPGAEEREPRQRGSTWRRRERAKTEGLNQAQKRESQDRGAQPGAEGSKTITYKFFCAQPPLPFQGRGRGRGVKKHGEPEGRKPESHTKTLTEGGLPPEAVKPPHIGGGLEGVDVSLLLSLRQRK